MKDFPDNREVREFLNREVSYSEYEITPAGSAGSDRRFYRITPYSPEIPSAVLVFWGRITQEWERYMDISREVSSLSSVLPKVYTYKRNLGVMVVQDCGTKRLKDICADESSDAMTIYRCTADRLMEWQGLSIKQIPSIKQREFGYGDFMWESDYFMKHCINQYLGISLKNSSDWERERGKLAERATSFEYIPVHRDFQSENVMCGDEIRFVDYQGARMGPGGYDIASLVYDPYAGWLNQGSCKSIIEYFTENTQIGFEEILICGIQRLMQACGAYANLGLNRHKTGFLMYIRPGLENLNTLLGEIQGYPAIKYVTKRALSSIPQ